MSKVVSVWIIGAPIACECGLKDSWRHTAKWAERQLKAHFEETVEVQYYDLFDADCPSMPPGAQLPLVLIDGEVVSSGGKISIPIIRRRVEDLIGREIA